MTLLRDSVIVGAATFLVGSVLKEISVKQEGEPVGWWPYVGTFMSGALGFYLLAATNVVKVKNAESTGCYECGQDYEGDDDFRNCDLCDVLLCGGCNRRCEGCSNTVCDSHRCSKDCCDGGFCDECHLESLRLGAESFAADGYKGISAPKIEILEWYVKKGGKAGFFHDLPSDVQIRLQMGNVHELLFQDVNRWLQDNGYNPHMETPDWLSAESFSAEGHCVLEYMKKEKIEPYVDENWEFCRKPTCEFCKDEPWEYRWNNSEKMTCHGCGEPTRDNDFCPYKKDSDGRWMTGDNCKFCCGHLNCESYVKAKYEGKIWKDPSVKWENYQSESPTDDELETWSERQEDGSMKVTIDEDGESHTELTYKDGDLTDLKRFMAEVFEADRKARRRTTLTWTRGMEPSFYDKGTQWMKRPRPYNVSGYDSDAYYEQENAYHISGLKTEGYHIHLWKPLSRKKPWRVFMKSPNSANWAEGVSGSKRYMMDMVLKWYNSDIATPEEIEMTPIQQLMIGQGMISGDVQIQRVVPMPGRIQYYFLGGSESSAPTLFATYDGNLEFNTDDIPSPLLHFCRGLIYIDAETVGSVRSVNRYNDDRKQWVSSHPAWFQNMCKQGIKDLHFDKDLDGVYDINGIDFLRFHGSKGLPENKYIDVGNATLRPMFQVRIPTKNKDWEWITPRPSTQKKMYNIRGMDLPLPISRFETEIGIFNKCIAKYQPQQWKEIHDDMLEGKVIQNSDGWSLGGSAPAGHIMCRRFKKK